MAAPQWVGFIALVNQARFEKGLKPLGYLNPILYKASKEDKARIFTDITTGQNGAFKATKGWDAVSGWGSMKAYEMLKFLSSH